MVIYHSPLAVCLQFILLCKRVAYGQAGANYYPIV